MGYFIRNFNDWRRLERYRQLTLAFFIKLSAVKQVCDQETSLIVAHRGKRQ